MACVVFIAELLLTCQLHNCSQLTSWCLHFISSNYLAYHQQDSFSLLQDENLDHVTSHRWPPTSYEQAMEEYTKMYVEESKEEEKDSKKLGKFKLLRILRKNVPAITT